MVRETPLDLEADGAVRSMTVTFRGVQLDLHDPYQVLVAHRALVRSYPGPNILDPPSAAYGARMVASFQRYPVDIKRLAHDLRGRV